MKIFKKIFLAMLLTFGLCGCNSYYKANPIYEYNKILNGKNSFSMIDSDCELEYHLNSYTSYRQTNYIDIYFTRMTDNELLDNQDRFSSVSPIFGIVTPNSQLDTKGEYIHSNIVDLNVNKVNITYLFESKYVIDDENSSNYRIGERTYHLIIKLDLDNYDYEYGTLEFYYFNYVPGDRANDYSNYSKLLKIYFMETDSGFLYNINSLKELKRDVKDFNKKYNGYLKYLAENNN